MKTATVIGCGIVGLTTAIKLQESGTITEYLEDLHVGGFIEKDYTWDIKMQTVSNMSHYRLKDNYIRFYLKYILPNKARVDKVLILKIK